MERSTAAAVRLSLLVLSSLAFTKAAYAEIEEMVVTAQKRAESVQDVPISVSAFDADALDARQIDTFSDLQFNVPNVSYSKSNFSGNNFQIRGIGNVLVATSADTGVAMHINDVYLNSPRIFETEYYDMEQVEILRGPQGTLFGRNATGGAVNLKTVRPELDRLYSDVEFQVGNFDHRRLKGAVNVPISEKIAGRIAGIWVDRDGYSDNVLTGNDIDDREQWSLRGSLRFDISDRTRLDIVAHRFDEDSTRTRSQKQFCDQDPSAILGCLPTSLETEPVNGFATLGTLLGSNLIIGDLGVFDFFGFSAELDPTVGNPSDLREVRVQFEPSYEADEDFAMFELQHDVTDTLSLTVLGAYQETSVASRQDYNGTAADGGTAVVADGFCAFSPAACTFFGTNDGGPLWTSSVPDPNLSLGAIGGPNDFTLGTQGAGVDLSLAESEQWSGEIRLTSSFDGPFNFLVSAYYMEFETETDYFVQAPGLDYASIALVPQAPSTESFVSLAPGYFNSETDNFELESLGLFGEIYYEFTDNFKVTVGLRYTDDEKTVSDRQVLLSIPTLTNIDGTVSYLGSEGPVPVENIAQLTAAAVADSAPGCDGNPDTPAPECVFDADPALPGAQVYRNDNIGFDEFTGRLVFDWFPEVSFTDETLLYLSFSRGFKSGGINPPIDTTLFPNTPTTFEPEEINAIEIGTKNTFWDRRAQFNASIFYYDYSGLQIGKIINRTSLNENTDAEIYGVETELLLAPTDNWLFNAQVSYLNTELGSTETIDPRDPSQGRSDVTVIKDISDASNCAIENVDADGNALAPFSDSTLAQGLAAGGAYIRTGPDSPLALPATPGITDSAFSVCGTLAGLLSSPDTNPDGYIYQDSIQVDLDGNELQQAPEFTVSLGAEYRHFFDNGMSLAVRLDYYWQDEFYSTTFNRPQDRINAWDIWNAQATLRGKEDRWFARAFVQNIENDDNITGTYQTDPSSGLFTNAFFVEPRLMGVTVGVSLGE